MLPWPHRRVPYTCTVSIVDRGHNLTLHPILFVFQSRFWKQMHSNFCKLLFGSKYYFLSKQLFSLLEAMLIERTIFSFKKLKLHHYNSLIVGTTHFLHWKQKKLQTILVVLEAISLANGSKICWHEYFYFRWKQYPDAFQKIYCSKHKIPYST